MNINSKLPNFFIVGAAKAGTTSIYNYLNKHPDIYMSPIKEPHYFSKDIRCKQFSNYYHKHSCYNIDEYFRHKPLEVKHSAYNIETIEQYLQLFESARLDACYLGEASIGYLYSDVAAQEIYEFNPQAKIIIILREPIERAFSHWVMDLRGNDVCRKSFVDAIKEDQENNDKGWGKSHLYIELGLYYDQVKRYQKIFPKKQILIMLYDDLKRDQDGFLKKIFSFLDIEPIKINKNQKHNIASIPKYPMLNLLIKKFKLNSIASKLISKEQKQLLKSILTNTTSIPKLTAEDREKLSPLFKEDIKKLQSIIDNDISSWYK